ncbi:hypothetical protein ACTXT7_002391 [Hymenolepis weldensis]
MFIISIAYQQVYEKLSPAASYHFNVNGSPLAPMQLASEIIVDPRLFGERYDQASSMENSGGSVTNIHPDDIFSLPAVYAAVCSGVVRNLVSMAPPESSEFDQTKDFLGVLTTLFQPLLRFPLVSNEKKNGFGLLIWANVKKLYCMGGAMKRNPLLLEQLISEYSSVDMNCISEDKVIEACVGAALYTATVIEGSESS